jgi:hypothetical protein
MDAEVRQTFRNNPPVSVETPNHYRSIFFILKNLLEAVETIGELLCVMITAFTIVHNVFECFFSIMAIVLTNWRYYLFHEGVLL